MSDDEGMTFADRFGKLFGVGDTARTEARRKAERQANLTPKQRARRKGPPKAQMNFRASAETVAQLKVLQAATGMSQTDVIAKAIAELAARQGVKVGKG